MSCLLVTVLYNIRSRAPFVMFNLESGHLFNYNNRLLSTEGHMYPYTMSFQLRFAYSRDKNEAIARMSLTFIYLQGRMWLRRLVCVAFSVGK